MIVEQRKWTQNDGWSEVLASAANKNQKGGLVFLFGYGEYFNGEKCFSDVLALYPDSIIVGCSTSGNILGANLSDEAVALSALWFEKCKFEMVFEDFNETSESYEVGQKIAQRLLKDDLKHIFVLSDGLNINGSKLADGINAGCSHIAVSGGLAGDSTSFSATYVIANAPAVSKRVVGVGFYGDDVLVSVGCYAGWDEFGAERIVTKSINNVVYEIDNKPALELYKSYLGEEAKELPGSGLKFPISIRNEKENATLIRTLLAIDEDAHSLTFAGDVPQGSLCKLMKANIEKLIDNSELAAKDAKPNPNLASLSIAVSCVGRRLVLGQLVEDELDVIAGLFGSNNLITGFYSYGELAPHVGLIDCKLHNQTMTITTIGENA